MTQIVCHMGARLDAPENTFPSAEIAAAKGGAVLELDIRQSRDGVLYVMHDETVDRTTNGQGAIAEMHSKEVDALDAGAWFSHAYAGAVVPRLDAYLAQMQDRMGFYLELKWADPEAVAALARKLEIVERCFTSSFSAEMRAGMRRYAPKMRHMVHWNIARSAEAAVAEHGAQIVEFFDENFAEADVRAAQDAGLETMLYTGSADRTRFEKVLELGLSFVNIDHIDIFRSLRDASR